MFCMLVEDGNISLKYKWRREIYGEGNITLHPHQVHIHLIVADI